MEGSREEFEDKVVQVPKAVVAHAGGPCSSPHPAMRASPASLLEKEPCRNKEKQ